MRALFHILWLAAVTRAACLPAVVNPVLHIQPANTETCMEGTVDLNHNRITGVATPIGDTDVPTKSYVDAAVAPIETAAEAQMGIDCPAGANRVYRVFVTNDTFTGDFGTGVGGAAGDAICQSYADSAVLNGTWGAFLCDTMQLPWIRWPGDWMRSWCRLTDVRGNTLSTKRRTTSDAGYVDYGGLPPPFGAVLVNGEFTSRWESPPTLDHIGRPVIGQSPTNPRYYWHGCVEDDGERAFMLPPVPGGTASQPGVEPTDLCCASNPTEPCWGGGSWGFVGDVSSPKTQIFWGRDVAGLEGSCGNTYSLLCFETDTANP